MSLTKHLYRVDEVRAALLYCIKSKRVYEACYWLTELEESCFGLEGRRCLFLAWFLSIGLSRVSGLIEWAKHSETREGRMRLCWQLARCSERDVSLWWILWCGVIGEPTVGQSKVVEAWRSQCQLDDEAFWEPIVNGADDRLEEVMEVLQTELGRYTIFGRVCAVALLSFQKKLPTSSWKELSTEEPLDLVMLQLEWSLATNVKEGRAYAIPQGCLYGLTWSGCGGDTLGELRELGLSRLKSSAYWKKLVDCDGDEWSSDDAKETFYDTYFPCDIPDEWPLADQLKSHRERWVMHTPGLGKWWRSWIQGQPHLYCWGVPLDHIEAWLREDTNSTYEQILDRVLSLYSKRVSTPCVKVAKKEFHLTL